MVWIAPELYGNIAFGVLTGLGVLAAGIGILFFGFRLGRTLNPIPEAIKIMVDTQERIAVAMERQAEVAQSNAKLVDLIETIHLDREQIGRTLRIISRRIEALTDGDDKDQATA
jgi:hypothetical protein